MPNQVDLSIIIVTWNSQAWIARCLASIFQRTSEISFEVIIVDNASRDQTVLEIMNQFEGVKVIRNDKNKGWATAMNQGIEVANGRYLCLLNPDTELYDRTLEQMVAFMEENPSVGVLGPHLMNEDHSTQPSVRRFPSLADQLMIILKLHVLFPDAKPLHRYLYRDFMYDRSQEVDQIMGACMMIRRDVIDLVGILDENFFVWFDEVDYCRRVKDRTSFSIFYYANAHLIHAGGASFDQVETFRKHRWYLRSVKYYFRRHREQGAYLILLLFTPLSYAIGFAGAIVKRSKRGQQMGHKVKQSIKTQN